MSTVIDDVYKCPKFKDVAALNNFFSKIGEVITKDLILKAEKRVISDYVYYLDDCAVYKKKAKKNKWDFQGEMNKKFDLCKVNRFRDENFEYDFHYKVIVMPYKKDVFIKLITKGHDYSDLFEKAGCEDYHYQNQTDRPEDVPSKDWNKRKKLWDNLITRGTYSKHGFTYDFSPMTYEFPILDMKSGFFPSLEKRSKRMAKQKILEKISNMIRKTYDKKDLKTKINIQISNESYWKYIDHIKTDKGKKELERAIEKYKIFFSKLDVAKKI